MATNEQEVVLIEDDNDTEIWDAFDVGHIGGEPENGGGAGGSGDGSSSSMEGSLPKPMESLNVNPFLRKTFEMVEDPETESIISWSDTKMSFIVWNVNNFCANLLPKYFKHKNLSSFITQLNSYGFRKINSDRYEYANEWFQRGNKHLLKNIKRKNSKKSQSTKKQKSTEQYSVQRPSVNIPGTLKLEMEVEKLRHEQKTLKEEIQKLKQEQVKMQVDLGTIKERLLSI